MPKLEGVASRRQEATTFDSTASNYDKLMWAISELEKRDVNICDIRKPADAKIQNKLVKLIGTKPIIKCGLDGRDATVLLDTGSQVSMCNTEWLRTQVPAVELRPVTDFLEEDEQVRF